MRTMTVSAIAESTLKAGLQPLRLDSEIQVVSSGSTNHLAAASFHIQIQQKKHEASATSVEGTMAFMVSNQSCEHAIKVEMMS